MAHYLYCWCIVRPKLKKKKYDLVEIYKELFTILYNISLLHCPVSFLSPQQLG